MKYLLIISFFLFSLNASAEPNLCINGEWQFNEKESDNLERLFKKLQHKQKQKQQVLNRPSGWLNEEKEDLSLTHMLPSFVFSHHNMKINIVDHKVHIEQQDDNRDLYTEGYSQGISLKALQQQSDTVVAWWEDRQLFVETTTVKGSRLKEVFKLDKPAVLKLETIIKNNLTKKEYFVTKVYQRLSAMPEKCILKK
jgi:hypothetical protein